MRLKFVVSLFCLAVATNSWAAMSDWTDLQGTTFKGEPSGVFGPFAVFKTGSTKARRVLLRAMSPQDCVRFYQELRQGGKLERASDWSHSRAALSANLRGRVYRLEKDRLLPLDTDGVREPELYVCFFASGWEGISYELSAWYSAVYARLKRVYGDEMETVFLGVRHDRNDGFMKTMKVRWLTVDYALRSSIDPYRLFAPSSGAGMVLLTREGAPLVMTETNDLQGMKRFVDELCAIMGAADEHNSLFWKDRAYYLANVRPVKFASAAAPALLVGNPLRASMLRKYKVERLAAKFQIDETGKPTSVAIEEKEKLSAALAASIEKIMLGNFVFVPAVDHGKAVASSYDFNYVVADDKPELEADRDWIILSGRKEFLLPNWLVLRPIPVPPEEFSQVQNVDAEGRATMSAVQVGSEAVSKRAQMNAFNSDFFAEGGAGSVTPVAGQSVAIGDLSLAWEKLESKDGLVDMRNAKNSDYSVGYAWSEFDAPNGGPAYLGVGSDDGVKIWLNGKLVHDRWVVRPTQIDQDIVRLDLARGKNTILVKIQNRKDHWSFLLRLRQ